MADSLESVYSSILGCGSSPDLMHMEVYGGVCGVYTEIEVHRNVRRCTGTGACWGLWRHTEAYGCTGIGVFRGVSIGVCLDICTYRDVQGPRNAS